MAFHDHLPQELAFQPFTDEQQLSQNRDMHRLLPFSAAAGGGSSGGGGGSAPTWLGNNVGTLRQQNFLHLQPDSADDVRGNNMMDRGGDRSRSEGNCESEDLAEYKADILGHPLYEQLLSAHVSCLRIATPVDQLPRIDAQLQQSQRVLEKYSGLGNGVVDEKELDQFMVRLFLSLFLFTYLIRYLGVEEFKDVCDCVLFLFFDPLSVPVF